MCCGCSDDCPCATNELQLKARAKAIIAPAQLLKATQWFLNTLMAILLRCRVALGKLGLIAPKGVLLIRSPKQCGAILARQPNRQVRTKLILAEVAAQDEIIGTEPEYIP